MSYWINQRDPARMRRIAHTAKLIAHAYELALEFESQCIGEEKDK